MLTLPSNYSTALASQFTENWIVKLYRDSTNFIGISFDTATVDSVSYVGSILNAPSIRDAINLNDGSSSAGNITLEVADHSTGSNMLSKELFVNNYINKEVKVYSILNGSTSLSDALQIFTGRLTSYTLTEDDRMSIEITSKRPWDGIDLPNEFSTTQTPVPVAYGDYTGYVNSDFMTEQKMYPCPRTSTSPTNLNYLITKSSSPSYETAHFYDSRSDKMGVLTMAQNTSATIDGKDACLVAPEIERTFKFRPTTRKTVVNLSNPERAHDTNTSNYAEDDHSVSSSGGGVTSSIEFELPSVSGKFTLAVVHIKADLTCSASSDITTVTLKDSSLSSTIISVDSISANSGSSFPVTSSHDTTHNILSNVVANGNRLPDTLKIELETSALASATSNVKLYDVWLRYQIKDDETNEPSATAQLEEKTDEIYLGNDGLAKSWDTSNIATKAEDVHRDILYRFLGVTDAPINYSDLSSEKNSNVRFWTEDEPKSMKDILNRLSFEGGFNFRFRADGDPIYHFIPNSPSAVTFSDSSTSLTHDDLRDMTIRHSALTDLVTKWEVKYERHPARDKYGSTETKTSSVRNNYFDSGSKENVTQEDLKYVVDNVSATGTNRNDSFLDYYDDMRGSVKIILNFKMINPRKTNLEVGDVIAFSSMEVNPFGGTWSGKKYIVTSTNRSVGGSLDIEAREI